MEQSPELTQARDILRRTFGYDDFRHNQADIIQRLIAGGDAMVLMPTGGGKSLCYQIPALVRPGTGVVVSPLIALMQDQVNALRQLGIRAAFLNSTLDYRSQNEVEQQLLNGELDLLYIAPERLLTERCLALLERSPLALFAIDEAHCVSQWGHDFRKEYQQLSVLHQRFPQVPRIALTATADERTRGEIIQQLDLNQAGVYINSFDRPNIRYQIAEGASGRQELWRFLEREHPNDAGIVYCLSRKKTEEVAQWLTLKGRVALPYHAKLPAQMRQLHQERFLREDGLIIVATIAFGMGIDKPDVRFVAHLNLPKSIESYYQETGRAGRDGQPASAWMAYGLQDVITLRRMNQDSDASEQYKRVIQHKLESMLGLCELTSCRRQALLAYFSEQLDQPCGNCDNCLHPPKTWDASVAAQKALSCVYRTGQRFGANHVVDVLLGRNNDRIRRFGHDRLTTYGIGTELNEFEWKGLFRQLMARGYLDIDPEGYGSLRLSERCRPLLKGEESLALRTLEREPKERRRKERVKTGLRPQDEALFEALRGVRTELAKEQGVPPYVIFHDQTLEQFCRLRPANEQDLQRVSGMGERKIAEYGQAVLRCVAEHPLNDLLDNNLSDTVNHTLLMFSQGMEAEAIARKRDLKPSTIYNHLADAVEAGLLDVREAVKLDDEEYAAIALALENHPEACAEQRMKPVFEELEQAYDYGIIRCVAAAECD
jgi:ATP-dependent DNA helicase RecQ